MREKVRARERFLIDQRLRLAGAKREGIRETAQNLKRLGVPTSTIAEAT